MTETVFTPSGLLAAIASSVSTAASGQPSRTPASCAHHAHAEAREAARSDTDGDSLQVADPQVGFREELADLNDQGLGVSPRSARKLRLATHMPCRQSAMPPLDRTSRCPRSTSLAAQAAIQVIRRADQSQVRKGLWKVPQRLAAAAGLLRVESQMVGVPQQRSKSSRAWSSRAGSTWPARVRASTSQKLHILNVPSSPPIPSGERSTL